MSDYRYATGTCTVTNGSAVVPFAGGALLQTYGIQQGDTLNVRGLTGRIKSVDSQTQVTLEDTWGGSTLSGVAYAIYRDSYFQSATATVAVKASQILAKIAGIVVTQVPETNSVPDSSIGEENYLAIKYSTWEFWRRTGGVWVALTNGFVVKANNLSDLTNAATARGNLGLANSATVVGRLARFTGTTGQQGQTSVIYEGATNVGIGTTTPGGSYLVDIGDGTGIKYFRINGGNSAAAQGAAIVLAGGGSNIGSFGNYSAIFGGAYDATFTIFSNNNKVLLPDSGIKVGVRTASPVCALDVNGPVRIGVATVGTLPAASLGDGMMMFVTDANATTQNSVVAGGGTNTVLVFSRSSSWRIG